MDLSSTIKRICKERGISINALESNTGIGRGNIGRWDVVSPSIEKVSAVADYLGISVDSLIKSDLNDTDELSQETLPLMDAAKGLKQEDIEMLINMAKRLKESYD